MKRVLIITYYWPPSGGGGVMRWLKMSKYLPALGWQPVIYTPLNPDPSVTDESLVKEVHPSCEVLRTRIPEPYALYRKLTGKRPSERFKAGYIAEASRGTALERLSVFIRGNLLIPDPRVFWVWPSVRCLRKYLREHPADLIISTGPPHSMHLIALGLKKAFPEIPWLADFRDPWTEIDFYHHLKLTPLADWLHHRLERKVLRTADVVTTVSPWLKASTEALAGRRVDVVYNGYDPSDADVPPLPPEPFFTLAHSGAFNRDRNPPALWKALAGLSRDNEDFSRLLKIRLIGQTDRYILEQIEQEGLGSRLEVISHLPHQEALRQLTAARVLLLPLNNAPSAQGILPGKMYEYMALGKPVLAIGPPAGDAAAILEGSGAGKVHDFDDAGGIKSTLLAWYEDFRSGRGTGSPAGLSRFSRENLAREIMALPFQPPAGGNHP